MAERSASRRRRKAERPAEIVEAALIEFAENGYVATRLEDVAMRAGITKGTIYVYFQSKEDLFVATLKEQSRPSLELLEAMTAERRGSALDVLRRHLAFVAQRMVEDRAGRDVCRILVSEGHRFPEVVRRWYAEVMGPTMAEITDVLRWGVERGEFRHCAAALYPQLVLAPIVTCMMWPLVAGEERPSDVEHFIGAAIDMLASGLVRGPKLPEI